MGDSTNNVAVETSLGVVTVHRMPLSDYAELLRAINALPGALKKFTDGRSKEDLGKLEVGDLLQMLPEILADSWTDFVGILAVPTDRDKDFLLQLDGADGLEIIDAILELNDFVRIANAVKKMQARMEKIQKSQQSSKLK